MPSAVSDSRCRDNVSMLRTVWKKPSTRWTPNGNQARVELAERVGRDPEHPARAGARAVARYVLASSQAWKPPAQTPGRSVGDQNDGFLAAGLAHQIDPAVDQHPPELGRCALVEQLLPFVEADLLAGREQRAQLVVGQPLEQEQVSEVVDVHQVVAR